MIEHVTAAQVLERRIPLIARCVDILAELRPIADVWLTRPTLYGYCVASPCSEDGVQIVLYRFSDPDALCAFEKRFALSG